MASPGGESCESFCGLGYVCPSAWLGAGAAGALLRCLDLGIVPRWPSVADWIWGSWVPLYSMVRGCHEAWQGASVTNQGSVSGGRARFQPAAGWHQIPVSARVANRRRVNHLNRNAILLAGRIPCTRSSTLGCGCRNSRMVYEIEPIAGPTAPANEQAGGNVGREGIQIKRKEHRQGWKGVPAPCRCRRFRDLLRFQ